MLELYNQGKTYTDALSGSHWAEDMIGIVQHDINEVFRKKVKKGPVQGRLIYAYRNPASAVLSLHKYLDYSFGKDKVIKSFGEWCSHIDWWLYNSSEYFDEGRLNIRFEDLERDAGKELKKIITFIFQKCDDVRCEVIGKVTTKDIISYVYDKWNIINKPILEYIEGEKEDFKFRYFPLFYDVVSEWPRVKTFCKEMMYI